MTRVLAVVFLAVATSAHAMHVQEVCPTLGAAVPTAPPVYVTTEKAARALENVRRHLARPGGSAPPGQLRKALRDRAPELAWVCRNDPDRCRDLLLSPAEAQQVANEPCAEKYAAFDGDVIAIRARTDETTSAEGLVFHETKDDAMLVVPLADRRKIKPGRRHQFHGVALGSSTVILADGEVTVDAGDGLVPLSWPTTGTIREVAVRPIHPDSPQGATEAEKRAQADWNVRYMQNVSFGKMSLAVTIPAPISVATSAPCDAFSAIRAVLPQLQTMVDLHQFEQIQLTSAYPTCFWGGNAAVGVTSWRLNDGSTIRVGIAQSKPNKTVDAHERGHALGLLHANRCDMAAERLPVGGKAACTKFFEYGRGTSVMGNSTAQGPWGVLPRWYLGYLTDGVDVLVNPPVGTYTLVPVSLQGPGVHGLVLREGLKLYVGLELRMNTDEFENTNAPGKRFNCVHVTSTGDSGAPEEIEHDKAAGEPCTAVGETFTSPAGWKIKVEAIDTVARTATVRIDGVGTPDLQPPLAYVTAPAVGTRVTGRVTLAAVVDDNPGTWRVSFVHYRTGQATAVATVMAPPWTATWDSATVADGPMPLYAQVCDRVGQCGYSVKNDVYVENGISTTTVPTTTTTTLPDVIYPVVRSHEPSPSVAGQTVRFVIGAVQNGQPLTPDSIHVNVGEDGKFCSGGTECVYTYARPCLPCRAQAYANKAGKWSDALAFDHLVFTGTTTTGATTSTTSSTVPTSTTSSPSTTTSSSSSTTRAPTTSTSTTLRPTTTSTRVPTTTTLRPTTTTLACRRKGVSCVVNGKKMASVCCSRTCGGARKCR